VISKDGTLAFDNCKVELSYSSSDFNTGFIEGSDEANMVFGSYWGPGKALWGVWNRTINTGTNTAELTGISPNWLGKDITFAKDISSLDGTLGVAAGFDNGIPAAFYMSNCRPNPSSGPMEFRFGLPDGRKVELSIYNLLGQRVVSLANNDFPAGHHRVKWNGRDQGGKKVAAGVYLYRLTAGTDRVQNKLVVVR
jgi:flagellar hook assembly protein FlgD